MRQIQELFYSYTCQQVKQQVSFFFSDAVEWDVVALDRVSDEHFQHQMYIKKTPILQHITSDS